MKLSIWMLSCLLFLSACGSSSKTPPAISVSLTPSAQKNIDVAQTLNFTATVNNDSAAKGVTWAISGTNCTGSACGTLTKATSTGVTYNAPSSATANMTVTVQATSVADTSKASSVPVVVSPEPAITTTSVSAGTVGTTYSMTLKASGGAGTLTWSLASGSALPAGLTLSPSGTISGTPTTAGTQSFSVKVTDASSGNEGTCSQTVPLSITIAPPPISVSLAPSQDTYIDQNQTLPFTATVANDSANKGVTWAVSGATCTGTACGTLTNSAAFATTYNAPASVSSNLTVTVQAFSVADTTKSAATNIVVSPPPTITTTTLANGTAGTGYTATLQATGGAVSLTWALASSSSLPAGLKLSSAGVISGTPTAPGTSSFTVKATDASQGQPGPVTASQPLSLTIAPAALTITTTSLPEAIEGSAYSETVQASGGTSPYIWTISSGSTLPSWLTLSASGTLSGTPTATGSFPFSLTVTDSGTPTPQNKSQSFTLTVATANAACGTGNESMLHGQYAFSLRGYNNTTSGDFLAAIGSFTADGNGHITAGTVDSNSLGMGVKSGSVTAAGSSYTVGSDNRGCATIVTPFYTFRIRFSLADTTSGPSAGGAIEEWEPGPTPYIAVGKLLLQKSIPAKLPAGSWVFQQSGTWYNGTYCPPMCRTGVVGVFKADGNGNFTDGEYDSSILGTVSNITPLTGTYTSADPTTGRFTQATTAKGKTSNRVNYLVSGTRFLELVSDAVTSGVNTDLVGEGELRSGSPTVSGTLVYYAAGNHGAYTSAQFGLITITSASTLTVKVYEDDQGTWVTPAPTTLTCNYSIDSYGRMTMASGSPCFGVGLTNALSIYLTGPNTGPMMFFDGGVTLARLEPQSATTLTPGSYFFGTVFDVAEYLEATQAGTVTINAGGATGSVDKTSTGSPQQGGEPVAETLTVNSDGTFSTSDNAGVIAGVIISNSKLVLVGDQKKAYPIMLVVSTTP
jgi:predicted secreted protein